MSKTFPMSLGIIPPFESPSLVPPITFGLVEPSIYRSGHPNSKSFPYLETLNLKSIMYLEDEDLRPDVSSFATNNNLATFHFRIGENDVWDSEVTKRVEDALRVLLDKQNYPILIFCNLGKAATTLLASLLRVFQNWSLTSIYSEGDRFAGVGSEGGGVGLGEREFIAVFEPEKFKFDVANKPNWL
ncbi:protein-tyrosine phosphatase [Mrakia frigida]|uniref:protein-tyrosine phosphatase n=1 Tax=Mrakia frigida TaxID=29902 RepID=UPI003FCC06D2